MTKMMLVLALAASALTFAPQPAAAAGCTSEYTACLNDSHHFKGALLLMADVECFARYTGCVRRQLFG